MNIWITVVSSAAVGVVVSSAITLLGQCLERRARRNELLMTKALEMAIRKNDVKMKALELSGEGRAHLSDEVISAETYMRWLKGLLDAGRLPPMPIGSKGIPNDFITPEFKMCYYCSGGVKCSLSQLIR